MAFMKKSIEKQTISKKQAEATTKELFSLFSDLFTEFYAKPETLDYSTKPEILIPQIKNILNKNRLSGNAKLAQDVATIYINWINLKEREPIRKIEETIEKHFNISNNILNNLKWNATKIFSIRTAEASVPNIPKISQIDFVPQKTIQREKLYRISSLSSKSEEVLNNIRNCSIDDYNIPKSVANMQTFKSLQNKLKKYGRTEHK